MPVIAPAKEAPDNNTKTYIPVALEKIDIGKMTTGVQLSVTVNIAFSERAFSERL